MNSIAIVGRPNVGKSTLVNRLVGKRETIVEEKPGVTRDRRSLRVVFDGTQFDIIDTGGWTKVAKTKKDRKGHETPVERTLDEKVSLQSEEAIKEADVIVLVVDTTTGVTTEDDQMASIIKASGKPAIVACNKVDNSTRVAETWEFLSLGFGDPIAISALHGLGTGELIEEIEKYFPETAPEEEVIVDDDSFHVAIAGRPNVGKSTLFNKLCGTERVIVHDMAGTTRDPVDTTIDTEMGALTFIDTAGLKKQSRQADNTEYYSSLRSFTAIDRADCVLFVVDGTEGVTHYDMRLLERIDAAGCALVILLNKWDLLNTEERLERQAVAKRELGFVDYAPIITLSALSGRNFDKIIPALFDARNNYEQRIPTAALNKVIHEAQIAHPHPNRRNNKVKISYATQGAVNPPTITLFATQSLDDSYMRYLENTLRDKFDLGSTSIKLRVRKKQT
ncbi:MAG TPA: ribosome biogenesis GTPase Der [Acidimicrobiia bacterium]|nr:ribosome biogenesis GTPase Der [Acidimicrobiia bacterium]